MDAEELQEGIYVLRTKEWGSQGDSNFSLIVGNTGAVLIDNDIRRVEEIQRLIGTITDKPIRFVINTHGDFDHVSANKLWSKQGAIILSSLSCRDYMDRTGRKEFQERTISYQSLKDRYQIDDIGLPDITVKETLTLHLDGKRIFVKFMGHGHSTCDTIVYLPEEEILVAGDLLFNGCHPVIRNSNIAEWLKILERLMVMPISSTVPGHGEITRGIGNIEHMHSYLLALRIKIADLVARKIPLEDAEQYLELREYSHLTMSERIPGILEKMYVDHAI